MSRQVLEVAATQEIHEILSISPLTSTPGGGAIVRANGRTPAFLAVVSRIVRPALIDFLCSTISNHWKKRKTYQN